MNWAGWILFITVAAVLAAEISVDMGAGYRKRAAKTAISGLVVLILLWIAAQGPRP